MKKKHNFILTCWLDQNLLKLIDTTLCFFQNLVRLITVSLRARVHKTVVSAGHCCFLCVQFLLFSPLSSLLLWLITSVERKVTHLLHFKY